LKVEAGESLIFSWLRHVMGCQIVQLNWKPSVERWGVHDGDALVSFIEEMDAHFRERRSREIFNKGDPTQLIRQGEIDVLGLRREGDGGLRLYAVDIANHIDGLNLGKKDRTIARVLKKMVRSAASCHGFFPGIPAEVLFASPKVNLEKQEVLEECFADINESLESRSLPVRVRLVCNEEFGTDIVQTVVDCAPSIKDTSELFLRSVQLCQSFGIISGQRAQPGRARPRAAAEATDETTDQGDGVGAYIQEQVQRLIGLGRIPQDEIGRLLDRNYTSRTFKQSYAFLKWHDPNLPRSEKQHHVNGAGRYYSRPLRIGDQHYYLCSQWGAKHRVPFDTWAEARMRDGA